MPFHSSVSLPDCESILDYSEWEKLPGGSERAAGGQRDSGTEGCVSQKERIFKEMSVLQRTASAVRTSSQRGDITTLTLGN